ncbi:MAG: histidine phosphatase family protein [Liquorilactobacillus nagelii]|jgi:broad specificity phosphatase PhoE|uniref:Histidine phosphatase family protein n=2 Tax=Liquorilactobacillus nagelii TaxID=82688 RepID=A0A3Q8CCZ7_9LACO|nr:phosphoglycerate mutase family protein [Liquorilactobacillus nagelii]AUJ32797.1 hypothetical protein BSQ50_09775 [Liquorilactobacillus nagelii]MCC7616991.1 hypothetical protein [Liquorilactobacillus nagelii]MCI1700673.1 histidine phosphatase family protein [Liquorilactobacillus nagelii]MCP9315780.1 histidine phosphatase family protein [Liquorilactobacillus nagelii]
MKKIYFVRHGETYFNRLNRMQGWSDTPLTALGKTTAVNFGRKLIETAPNISKNIYCSDTGRASKTAAKIIEGLKKLKTEMPAANQCKNGKELMETINFWMEHYNTKRIQNCLNNKAPLLFELEYKGKNSLYKSNFQYI